jgi:superfamily I DNA/RNA helicase
VKLYTSKRECLQLVEASLKQLLGPGHLSRSQVAVLSPFKREHSCVAALDPDSLTEDLEVWNSNDRVLFSTIKGFKGLEAEAVIMADLEPSMEKIPAELYVAASRARHLLIVLTSSRSIAEMAGRSLKAAIDR